jgi:opacity protein-like surface antigen
MTRLNTLVAVLLAATAVTSVAHAADTTTTTTSYHSETYYHWNPMASNTTGLYVAAQGGESLPTSKLADGGAYAVSLGWQFHPMIRTELEVGYRNNNVSNATGEARTWTYMANGYWDIKNNSIVTPYLGAGLGYANSSLHQGGSTDTDGAFVWQAIAGASVSLTNNWALTADYRYIDTTNFKYNDANHFDYTASEIRGGLRYTF